MSPILREGGEREWFSGGMVTDFSFEIASSSAKTTLKGAWKLKPLRPPYHSVPLGAFVSGSHQLYTIQLPFRAGKPNAIPMAAQLYLIV